MKKLIYCAAALVTALFAGSCQRELLDPAGGNGTVTYTVQVPEIGTKALGDDVTVINDLVYAVYRTTENSLQETLDNWETAAHLVYDKNVEGQAYNQGKTTVSLELINNQNYVILFWAQKDDAWVSGEDFDLTKITYPADAEGNVNMIVNSSDADKYAAFSGVEFLAAGDFAGQKTAILTRPFAQINIAAKDPHNYDVNVTGAIITVKNAGNEFNVAKKAAATTKDQVTYTWTTKPETSAFKVNNVAYEHYVAMNYVFAYDNVKVAYDIHTENHGTVSNEIINVPVEKNYRTNIVGNLLTSNVDYNVELDTDWGPAGEVDDDKVVSVWDGTSISEPTYDATSNTYTIYKAEELAWVAAAVNGTLPETRSAESISFSGKTVVLAADINLNGKEWTPIGISGKYFEGTFDGANHTVSNYQINREGHAGLFGNARATIENLTVKDVTIVANHYAGAIVGQGYAKINNCHVENADIVLSTKNNDWGDKAGGIIGQNCEGATMCVKNSTAKNVTITGYRDLGGIAGMAHAKNIVSGCSVENITITQDLSVNYETTTPTTVDAVVGRVGSNATIENNEVVGGIVIEKIANDNATFAELLKNGGNIVLKAGEYTFPAGNIYAGEVNVSAAEEANVTITLPKSTYISGTSLTLDGITFKVPSGLYYDESNFAFIHSAEEFNMNNCVIEGGRLRLNVKEANIDGCQFTCDTQSGFDGYGLFYYGNPGSTVNVANSTFTTLGKAIVLYNEGAVTLNLNVDNCRFISSDSSTDKTAIQMHSEYGINGNVTINNSTATGFADINGGLWYDVNNNTKQPNTNFNITVDGVGIVRVGYSKLENYPNIWIKDNNYYVFDKAGLTELNNFFKVNSSANHVWTRSYNIGADIDATELTWDCVYVNVGDNALNGLVFNGNGYTISNLEINGGGLFSGTPNGGNDGTNPGYVKNITIDNATVVGDHFSSVFWSCTWGDVVYENVVVKNTSVTGNCNVGVFVGATAIEYPISEIDPICFKNCAVENCTIVANGKNGQDPTGASGFVGRAFGKTSLKFEGTNTINEATTITNNNGLVGGRVYGYTTWYGDGFTGTGACDTFTDFAGVEVVKVGDNVYGSFAAAVANANAGDTIALLSDVTLAEETEIPAGVTLKGNGNQINGSIYAGGDLTFEGHTKVTSFSASYYNRTITIGEGACLEVTGSGRVSLAYGNTFNITGSIENAKTADKANVQPSLIIPAGISITGGNDATMNVADAYVQIGSTTSKPGAANGKFTLNFTNSIVEFTKELGFYEPTGGMNPNFNLNLKNSVLTTGTKLCIAAPNTSVSADNSTITIGTYFRNSGYLKLDNKSSLTGNTTQHGENSGNTGTTEVDNQSKMTITAPDKNHPLIGETAGKIKIQNQSEVSVTFYKSLTIEMDATSTFTGTEVQ